MKCKRITIEIDIPQSSIDKIEEECCTKTGGNLTSGDYIQSLIQGIVSKDIDRYSESRVIKVEPIET